MGNVSLVWTHQAIATLKKLWSEGLPCSSIAAQLGSGFSRNAVIGKVHRLGLERRRPSLTPEQLAARKRSHVGRAKPVMTLTTVAYQAPTPPPIPIRLPEANDGGRLTVFGLSDKTCKWPIGDPMAADFCFCGHEPRAGSPYCEYHARLSYRPRGEALRPHASIGAKTGLQGVA